MMAPVSTKKLPVKPIVPAAGTQGSARKRNVEPSDDVRSQAGDDHIRSRPRSGEVSSNRSSECLCLSLILSVGQEKQSSDAGEHTFICYAK